MTIPPEEPASSAPRPDRTDLQFDYAWKWFEFHADQRTKMFNFMLVTTGILAAAIATLYKSGNPSIAIILCIGGVILSVIFSRLDRRNRDLLWFGEDVLIELEKSRIFGEDSEFMSAHAGKRLTLGILWRQEKNKDRSPCAQITAPLLGMHRFWNPVIAYVIAALFAAIAFYLWRDFN